MIDYLVHEKDELYQLILAEKYEDAMLRLLNCRERWELASYGYKFRELRETIIRNIKENIFQASHWKTRKKWEKVLEKVS